MILFVKSRVKGYTKRDGTYVKEHETKKQTAFDYAQSALSFSAWKKKHSEEKSPGSLFNGEQKTLFPTKPPPPPEGYHPRLNDQGKRVPIYHLHHPTEMATWYLPHHEAACVPGGPVPKAINGVPFAPWRAPTTPEEWNLTEGINRFLVEPPFDPGKMEPAAGVVIEEEDGRVWVVCPTNRHAGYKATYPKGHAEKGLSLQATALKEAWEESGLQAEITGFIGDFPGGLTMTRYYRARRIGGTPAAMGWETQSVKLVPADELGNVVNASRDKLIAETLFQ